MTRSNYYVYVYSYPDGTPFYVGKGTGNRDRTHLCDAKAGRNLKKWAVRITAKILREGQEPLIERVLDNAVENEALDMEIALIAQYGRIDIGTGCLTNCTDGGDRGAPGLSPESLKKQTASFIEWSRTKRVVDDEYKKRISEGVKKYYETHPVTAQRRQELSKNSSGENNAFYGKKHSEDTRKIMSESHTGVALSEAHKKKLSEAKKEKCDGELNNFFGKTHSETSKQKIGAASRKTIEERKAKGQKHWNTGRTTSAETLAILRREYICPHCGLTGRGSAMNRYHFDNCKKVAV
jgi:hypothetical protein